MPRLLPALLVAGLLSCSTVDNAIWRAELGENIKNIWAGKDRGVNAYAATIDQFTSRGFENGRYAYVAPAYTSNFRVNWSVLGLGRTKTETAEELALVVDRLFYALARDPTGSVRASACTQLGKILARQRPEGERFLVPPPEPEPHSDSKINQVAKDLFDMQTSIEEGNRILQSDVVDRISAMSEQRPTTFRSARQMTRVLCARPIAGVAPGAVRDAANVAIPILVRDCIQISLREIACGRPESGLAPDPDPHVRRHAAKALAAAGSVCAVREIANRLNDAIDPFERDPEVRRDFVNYLGEIGGETAFEACVRLVIDLDSGVRFHAQRALRRMTGIDDIPATVEGWTGWRQSHPGWSAPARESGGE